MIKFYETLENIGFIVFATSLVSAIMGIGGAIYYVIGFDGMRIVVIFSGIFFAIYLVILVLRFFGPKEANDEITISKPTPNLQSTAKNTKTLIATAIMMKPYLVFIICFIKSANISVNFPSGFFFLVI